MVIIAFVGMMNTFTEKPGKFFQSFGTGFQILPLLLIMVLVIMLLIVPDMFTATLPDGSTAVPPGTPADPIYDVPFIPVEGVPNSFNPNSTINGGYYVGADGELVAYGTEQEISGMLRVLILALPPIMFTFDGFLFASSMQNEAKSQKTFPMALVLGILLISLLYFFVAMGTIETASVPPVFMPGTQMTLVDQATNTYEIVANDGKTYIAVLTPEEVNYLSSTTNTQGIVIQDHFD